MATWFAINFNTPTYSVGDLDTQDGWARISGNPSTMQVATSPLLEGDQSCKYRLPAGGQTGTYERTIPTGQNYELTFLFKNITTSFGRSHIGLKIGATLSWELTMVGSTNITIAVAGQTTTAIVSTVDFSTLVRLFKVVVKSDGSWELFVGGVSQHVTTTTVTNADKMFLINDAPFASADLAIIDDFQGNFIVVPSPSSPPLALTAVAGIKNITLNWNAPENDGGSPITNYKIFRATTSGGQNPVVPLTTIGNFLTFVDTTAAVGTKFFYKVKAVNANGDSEFSNEASATILPSELILDFELPEYALTGGPGGSADLEGQDLWVKLEGPSTMEITDDVAKVINEDQSLRINITTAGVSRYRRIFTPQNDYTIQWVWNFTATSAPNLWAQIAFTDSDDESRFAAIVRIVAGSVAGTGKIVIIDSTGNHEVGPFDVISPSNFKLRVRPLTEGIRTFILTRENGVIFSGTIRGVTTIDRIVLKQNNVVT